MGVFDRQTATALRLIDRYGAAVTWRKFITPDDDNPADPTDPAEEDHPVKIAFFTNNELSLFTTLSSLLGTEVPNGKMYGIMGHVDFIPQLTDLIVGSPFGDLRLLQDNGLDELNPNGEGAILYTLRFSR